MKPPSEEQRLMRRLQSRLAEPATQDFLARTAERLLAELRADPAKPKSTFSAIPLDLYADLPADIRSSWVFALRGGLAHPPERHPNSIQRMFALGTAGRFDWWDGRAWVSETLEPNGHGLSIAENVWHRMPAQDGEWVVVSFHTADPDALIEIVGDPETGAVDSSRAYLPG